MIEATTAAAPLAPIFARMGQPLEVERFKPSGATVQETPEPAIPANAGAAPPGAGETARIIAEIRAANEADKAALADIWRAREFDEQTKSSGERMIDEGLAGPSEMARRVADDQVDAEAAKKAAEMSAARKEGAEAVAEDAEARNSTFTADAAAKEARGEAERGYETARAAQEHQMESAGSTSVFA